MQERWNRREQRWAPTDRITKRCGTPYGDEQSTGTPRCGITESEQARRRLRLGAPWRFARHLLEMVAVMIAGMVILMVDRYAHVAHDLRT